MSSVVENMEDRDIRVEDYLNDRLQTSDDLSNLEDLLSTVRTQQGLLRKQLLEAEDHLRQADHAAQQHQASVLEKAEAFRRQQADIDRRLLIVTRSETSDEAASRFGQSMDQLQRLEVATAYVNMLKEIERLREGARSQMKGSTESALEQYKRLRQISSTLKVRQAAAEGAAPHLVDHADQVVQDLWKEMKDFYVSQLEATLKKIHWPDKDAVIASSVEDEWQSRVEALISLQAPELQDHRPASAADGIGVEPLVLLPFEVLAKPLELRFRYHFDGDRPTNRLDKPEYFMAHVQGLLNTYQAFIGRYLQPILTRKFHGSDLALDRSYVDATSAWITALLPMLRRKILSTLPQIAEQAQLLSHIMHELMSFDDVIRDEWGYDGGHGVEGWSGLTSEVLVKHDWFGRWLRVEQDFALARYQAIIEAKDAWEIDVDSVEAGMTKPTKASIRVNDLLETITERYRPLTSFSHKLRFLIDIQIAIFDQFHGRLQSALEAYLAATSAVVRAVQGVSKEERAGVEGLAGLERLCRVYGSAEYLERAMGDWGDDVFFLELWDELQDRARRNSGSNLAGPMSLEAVAERTSSAVGSDEDSGALFDETASAYRRLRVRAEEVMVDRTIHHLREGLRPYTRITSWTPIDAGGSTDEDGVSVEMEGSMRQVEEVLSFLSSVLAVVALRRIGRQISGALQAQVWDYVLMRHRFSAGGAGQLRRDLVAMWRVLDRYLGGGQGESGMRKLSEATVLLNLESEGSDGAMPALAEAELRIFESNEKARELLETLGLTTLTEAEARSIVERRVELGR